MTRAPLSLAQLRARRLSRRFFARPVEAVARGLLGCALIHAGRAAMIVEAEAYGGPADLASHARFGVTARTAPMFGPPGHAYVYLCYGTHEMFNVVTGHAGQASAVLVRAAAPLLGLPEDPAVAAGPGKLTRALALDRRHNALDLLADDSPVWLARARRPPKIVCGPRVGVDYAGAWARAPLRFAWSAHPSVSRPAPRTPWP
ncbi:MAG: DNA-3-methyladenine glycosylase [Kofleriaceae bacterium]